VPCLCCSASVPSSRSFLETSSVFQVFNFNSIFNAYLFFSVCYYSLCFPFQRNGGPHMRRPVTPPHRSTSDRHSRNAHITSFSSTSLSLIHFSPSFLPRRRTTDCLRTVLGCALLAFGCSARTLILRAQRLDCLGCHLCTHSTDFCHATSAHICSPTFALLSRLLSAPCFALAIAPGFALR
jgi:hypothetical protein